MCGFEQAAISYPNLSHINKLTLIFSRLEGYKHEVARELLLECITSKIQEANRWWHRTKPHSEYTQWNENTYSLKPTDFNGSTLGIA